MFKRKNKNKERLIINVTSTCIFMVFFVDIFFQNIEYNIKNIQDIIAFYSKINALKETFLVPNSGTIFSILTIFTSPFISIRYSFFQYKYKFNEERS